MMDFINALPGAVSQGLIWGIMAIGVYITYKILDVVKAVQALIRPGEKEA